MKLPNFVEQFFLEKRYPELIYFFRKLYDAQAWLYLKRNKNAVVMIKEEFFRLTKKRPYDSAAQAHWDKQIAKYVDRLGVKALIMDMQEVIRKNRNINSILYFIYSNTGACRWENLLMEQIQKEIQARKREENAAFEEMARAINFSIKPMAPEWVVKARQRLDFLKRQKQSQNLTREMVDNIDREVKRIKHNLKTNGY